MSPSFHGWRFSGLPWRASLARTGLAGRPGLDHAQRVVGQHDFAALVEHLVGGAQKAAVRLAGRARLDDLAFDMDGVACGSGFMDLHVGFQECHAGALHGALHQQSFGHAQHQGAGDRAAADDGDLADVLDVGEHFLDHPDRTHELG